MGFSLIPVGKFGEHSMSPYELICKECLRVIGRDSGDRPISSVLSEAKKTKEEHKKQVQCRRMS